mmetsp:Transcript_1471/g.5292  ORF Transcript_1471/g.5292 Transcript_1471/m.5292 type:complete len:168 (+) Transcript_1471:3-506(+)
MTALRWLALGCPYDAIAEMAQTSETLVRITCQKWVHEFTTRCFGAWVRPPEGGDLAEQMEIFARCGFPGAVASADVVHIAWDQCPAGLKHENTGKGGFPTRAFTTHSKRIIAVTAGHPGARNDKTITRYDGFIMGIKEGEIFQNLTFTLRKQDGSCTEERGAYVIVD